MQERQESFDIHQAIEALSYGVPVKRSTMKNQILHPEQATFHIDKEDMLATDWIDASGTK